MNRLKYILFFLFYSGSCLSYPLDVHVHYNPKDFYQNSHDGAELFLSQTKFEKALLISPSFHVNPLFQTNEKGLQWVSDLKQREILDDRTVEIVHQNPNRFLGLCGYNVNWPDAHHFVKRCLSKKGMIGVKIHTENTLSRLQNEKVIEKIKLLFSSIENRRPIVLWHLDTGAYSLSNKSNLVADFRKEMLQFEQLIRQFQKITFIMAHALYVDEGLQFIKDIENNNGRLNNLYIEISTRWHNTSLNFDEQTVKAWREFGFERILFGSDLGFISSQEQNQFVSTLENSNLFTDEERNQLLLGVPNFLLNKIMFLHSGLQ